MTGHIRIECKECGKVISQCRCMACDKVVEFGLCNDCKAKIKANADQITNNKSRQDQM